MSNFSDQIEEIKTSISSSTNKPLAYSILSYLQEQSGNNAESIQTLAENTPILVSLIVADIHDPDEEIAVLALKCLGFMIYQQSLVAAILVDGANLVLDSLVKLITTTKMKSVCNLGIWCISVQQFNEPVLASHFDSLLLAVAHGFDNPFGSLSTTFEASQAVMKLGTQLGEKMRNSSHVWAPPIYRRLLSLDKRERDMSERCLMKIGSLMVLPPLSLSKALVKDLRQTLLIRMKDLLNSGRKIQAIQAWGWFMKLLGSYSLKNRNLINDMLKIPESTFSDHDPQLQIASLAAWDSLIDALIHPEILPFRNVAEEDEQMRLSKRESHETQANRFSKSVKLIMRPLVGIMSSKCDAPVYGSCFNTWSYLLYKLDSLVNCLSMKELVLQPVFETIFRNGPDCKGIWLWNQAIDLLDDSILAKSGDVDKDSSGFMSHHLSSNTYGKCSWKQYRMKWLPWESGQLDFHLKFIYVLINRMSKAGLTREERSFVNDASFRLFRSVSKGVQIILKEPSTIYDDILSCLSTLLKFVKDLWEEHCHGSDRDDWCDISLQLVQVVIEEIEPSVLVSPLYKMVLDLKHINESQSNADETRHAKIFEISTVNYMDTVTPMAYLTVLCFHIIDQSNLDISNSDFVQKAAQKYWKIVLSSYEPSEMFIVTVRLLYKGTGPRSLRLWIAIAKGLMNCLGQTESISLFKSECAYVATCDLLCFPFVTCYCFQKDLMSAKISGALEDSHVSIYRKVEFEQVVHLWKSLSGSLSSQFECSTANSFSENMCNTLASWLDKFAGLFESPNMIESSHKDMDLDHISVYGGVVICILEKFQSSEFSQVEQNSNSSGYKFPACINSCLTLAIGFMKLLLTKRVNDMRPDFSVFYTTLAHFISRVHLKEKDTHSFVEIISSPLLRWLTQIEARDEITNRQFQLILEETLNCLRRSQPPLVFDSAFLELQSHLLEKTLDHPSQFISEPTISFWNSTYGDQTKLEYPENLLRVLHKLSRSGKINLRGTSPTFLGKCNSDLGSRANAGLECSKTTKLKPSKDIMDRPKHKDVPCVNMKRKRLELTERQKEVRRAQRGRERDCGGHGLGGVRTYTNLDFSQRNEDSQESQEIWNLEFVSDLDKLGKR